MHGLWHLGQSCDSGWPVSPGGVPCRYPQTREDNICMPTQCSGACQAYIQRIVTLNIGCISNLRRDTPLWAIQHKPARPDSCLHLCLSVCPEGGSSGRVRWARQLRWCIHAEQPLNQSCMAYRMQPRLLVPINRGRRTQWLAALYTCIYSIYTSLTPSSVVSAYPNAQTAHVDLFRQWAKQLGWCKRCTSCQEHGMSEDQNARG